MAAAESLLKANGSWSLELGDEIFVFSTNGTWVKDHALWLEVQKADWDDVILDEGFKKKLQKDVYGFFKSEETYKRLASHGSVESSCMDLQVYMPLTMLLEVA